MQEKYKFPLVGKSDYVVDHGHEYTKKQIKHDVPPSCFMVEIHSNVNKSLAAEIVDLKKLANDESMIDSYGKT